MAVASVLATANAQTIWVVSATTDNGSPGELRAAVFNANTDGTDSIINFTGIATLPATITLNPINGPLVLAVENRTWVQGPGATQLEIDAGGAPYAFVMQSHGCAISDLAIHNTTTANVRIDGSMYNWIYGCYVGLDSTGAAVTQNQTGVLINNGAAYNLVGTDGVPTAGPGGTPGMSAEGGIPLVPNIATGAATDVLERNIISNNKTNNGGHPAGVFIDQASYMNRVAGNYIGTDVAGATSIPNGDGVAINVSFENIVGISDNLGMPNYLGGGEANEWNLISGNDATGVLIDASNLNVVAGNIIGPDVTGLVLLLGPNAGNLGHGVHIFATAQGNVVGTNGNVAADIVPGAPTGGERNVISNNAQNGVYISALANLNRVAGNYIGLDLAGALALPNGANGVEVEDAPQNVIGTNADGNGDAIEGNVISGNQARGVVIFANQILVWGNIIGLDAAEAMMTPSNGLDGVLIGGGQMCSIGYDHTNMGAFLLPPPLPSMAQRNVISGNGLNGVRLASTTTSINALFGNRIGTDSSATLSRPNAANGVLIDAGASTNIIGMGSAPANVIANNAMNGVMIDGSVLPPAVSNVVSGNSITANALLGIDNVFGGNTEEPPPVITGANTTTGNVDGTSLAEDGSVVEVFTDTAGQGATYLGSATVNSGTWSATALVLPTPPFNLTATVTDTSANTSEFSAVFVATSVTDWEIFDR